MTQIKFELLGTEENFYMSYVPDGSAILKQANPGLRVPDVKKGDQLNSQITVRGQAGGQHHPVNIQMVRPALSLPVPRVQPESFDGSAQAGITLKAIQLQIDRMTCGEFVRFFSHLFLHPFNGVQSDCRQLSSSICR